MWKLERFIFKHSPIGSILLTAFVAGMPSESADAKLSQFPSATSIPNRIQIAKNRFRVNEKNACIEFSHGFVLAKTKSFYIEICGSRTRPMSYYISTNRLGKSQKPEKIFDVAFTRFNRQIPSDREEFIAIRGNIKHTLTPRYLRIQQKGLIIVTEPVIYYRRLK
ncbi:MAG: hypothetical protein LH613_15295 [Chamaesiphon sp.]|nr:hypothetical protein [Chamaesiphon sp.]